MGTRRLNLGEAAQVLGVTREAVRRRAKRGTLPSEKGDDGRLYVWVHADHHTVGGGAEDLPDRGDLVGELRDQVQFLRRELERKDTIIMSLTQRIPELESAPEPRERPEQDRVPGDPDPLPWWKRWFGAPQS